MREGRKETVPRSTRNLQALVSTRNVSLRRYNEAPRRPRRKMFWPSQPLVISVSGRIVAAPLHFGGSRRKRIEEGGRRRSRFHDFAIGEEEDWRKDCSKREFDGEKGSMVPR